MRCYIAYMYAFIGSTLGQTITILFLDAVFILITVQTNWMEKKKMMRKMKKTANPRSEVWLGKHYYRGFKEERRNAPQKAKEQGILSKLSSFSPVMK